MKNVSSQQAHEPHQASENQSRLNWLRASVLGANDGIVSIAGLVLGVAGATNSQGAIFTAGLAGIIAGAISMAAGEYVSVSSQSDSEKALLTREQLEIHNNPEQELAELAATYEKKGLEKSTAMIVAKELTAHDAFAAHVDAELRIDPHNLTNPWHAAMASAISFICGAAIPLLAILVPPVSLQVPVTFISVVVALVITGVVSGKVGDASVLKAVLRIVGGGAIAMAVTYGIGRLFGVSGI